MEDKKVIEVCVDSVESALAAKAGGADRLELCANLIIGGTTPSLALFDAVRAAAGLPINVLIRPRFGDFLYTDAECDIMRREIEAFAARGANAVVIGALKADGALDEEKMKGFIAAAGGIHITLHRAIDVSRDLEETLEIAAALGVDTVLTSGGKASAWQGRETIVKLLDKADGRVQILIGGGVNAKVIADFRREYPATSAFHLSGKRVLDSGMIFRNGEVNMGLPGISEFQVWRTDENAVREAVRALREE